MLKRKCASARLNAASFLKSAANNAVIVVPKLAPKINGKPSSDFTFPTATIGTNNEVVTELDCIVAVIRVPQQNDLRVPLNRKLSKSALDSTKKRIISLFMILIEINSIINESPNNTM